MKGIYYVQSNTRQIFLNTCLFYNFLCLYRFLVNMVCAFQDRDNLYLVIDLMTGGDLRYHLNKRRTFSENETSIYMKF